MKKVAIGALILGILGIFIGVGYLAVGYTVPAMDHETTITAEEVVITRVAGFNATVTYSLDRKTGDERVIYHEGFVDGVRIDRLASCQCIQYVSWHRGDWSYSMHLSTKDGARTVKEGRNFPREEILPPGIYSDQWLKRAEEIFNETRDRIRHLIPKS